VNIYSAFKNSEIAENLIKKISKYNGRDIKIMEVCGSHTNAIAKYGIKNILPKNIKLISGPGCPVCVTDGLFIETAVKMAYKENTIVCTFGDLMRVRANNVLGDSKYISLEEAKKDGCDVRVVISPLECLDICSENPTKEVVFISVGFETTTPIIALTIKKAQEKAVENFSTFVSNKTMPKILNFLLDNKIEIDAFLFPGHVCSIEGTEFYRDFCFKNNIYGVISGFEVLDILGAISFICDNIDTENKFENLYPRFVKDAGNVKAKEAVSEIFEACDTYLRGIGTVAGAGLKLKNKYDKYNALLRFNMDYDITSIDLNKSDTLKNCLCGEILLGKALPCDCTFFGKICTPENAIGPCMVSGEGTCSAYYKYKI